MNNSNDDASYDEHTNIVQDPSNFVPPVPNNPNQEPLNTSNSLIDTCNVNLNNRLSFFKVQEKILENSLDDVDVTYDNININEISEAALTSFINKEQTKQLNDEEILEYLISNDTKDPASKTQNKQILTTLSMKLEKYLEKKNKKLETIQEKINHENSLLCPFSPDIHGKRRKWKSFQQFIDFQHEHLQRVRDKIHQLKQSLNDDDMSLYRKVPLINKNSRKIASNINEETNVYDRLYNKMKYNNELTNSNSTNSLIRSTIMTKEKEEYLNNLYQDYQKRQDKLRSKQNEINNELAILRNKNSSEQSNKILYNKFKSQFQLCANEVISSFTDDCMLTYKEFVALMFKLNFITKKEQPELTIIWECLYQGTNNNNTINKINLDHLFIFCLSIVGLLNYYIVHSYTSSGGQLALSHHPSTRSISTVNTEISDFDMTLIQINNELAPKITKAKRYGGFDEYNNYIITPYQSRIIFNDFIHLYYNWKNVNTSSSSHQKIESFNNNNILPARSKSPSMRTLMNNKSQRTVNSVSSTTMNTEGNLFAHINQSKMRKKELERTINEKRKAQETAEMANCTFKPKINKNSLYKDNIVSLKTFENNINESVNEILYQKGKAMNQNRFDKNKEDIQYERECKECTFKPKINKGIIKAPNVNCDCSTNTNNTNSAFGNSVYDEEKYFDRINKGRIERELKQSFLALRDYSTTCTNVSFSSNNVYTVAPQIQGTNGVVRRNKSAGRLPMPVPKSHSIAGYNNVTERSKTRSKSKGKGITMLKKAPQQVVKKSKYYYIYNVYYVELIISIDVGLKNGIKKKLYVYEGDKSEELAKKFAAENSKCYIYIYNYVICRFG